MDVSWSRSRWRRLTRHELVYLRLLLLLLRAQTVLQQSNWAHASARGMATATAAVVVLVLLVLLLVVVVVGVSRRTITARRMCMTNHVHRL